MRKPYEQVQALLAPHQDQWVEVDCVAALIPLEREGFTVQVNGFDLTDTKTAPYLLDGLRRRMASQKLPIRVTTCAARIHGGGHLQDGRKRGYGISLDLQPFPE